MKIPCATICATRYNENSNRILEFHLTLPLTQRNQLFKVKSLLKRSSEEPSLECMKSGKEPSQDPSQEGVYKDR